MKNISLKSMLTAALLSVHLCAPAEDIDLFVGAAPATTADVPNVLIVVDNTANWNTAFANEMKALVSTVNGLPENKFRLGLMMFTETGGGDSGNDGSYVRAAVRLLDPATKPKYMALVNGLDRNGDKSNGGKLGKTMVEVYRYFSGAAPYAGNNKAKTDYAGNTSGTASSNAIYALPGNALPSKAGSPYASPVISGCAKNFIIYISNGAVQDNTNDTSAATTELKNAGGNVTPIPISPSGSQDNVGDEWARFLKQTSMNIVTYTVDVDKVTNGQGPGWSALLKSMANVGGGKYFDVDSSVGGGAEISDALNNIFSEIQAVNSVFASVSLPVSVNTQGTYLNQVYVGMFRPDQDAAPRWNGNLKQYKMGMVNNVLKLLDAQDQSAINSQTGFVTECARSYWTPAATDGYWGFRPQGGCIPPAGSASDLYLKSNSPDGNIVEKGAQAYKLRSTTARNVKTCSPVFASCTTLTSFDTSNGAITQSLLGATSSAERDALINWGRGLDLDDENTNGASSTEMRPSAHGDVVHSRPVAINYGTESVPKVVVYYGGNDGMLRAINGNRADSIGSVPAGGELWSFVAPESYANFKRIRDNSTKISTPTTVGSPKPYAIDGPISAYKDASHTWIYATMRRGGRAVYAFDVTTPDKPVLKWKKGCPNNFSAPGVVDDTDCTKGFTGIGQTWSAVKTLKAAGYVSGSAPLLIMGGGYDTCEDRDPNNCTLANKGNKIYVLDAIEGTLLRTLDTERSVVGDVVVVPDSATGLARYAYAADLGGNVYRIDIGAAAPADWAITRIAALGCDTPTACSANRKFMFGPDVVEENGDYILLIGSGDREKPLTNFTAAYNVTNHFFMLKDRTTDAGWLSAETDNCGGVAVICKNSLLPILGAGNPDQASLNGKKGWYLGFASHEQVVTSAITLYGQVTFSTHQPAVVTPGSCSANLGTANVYNVNYTDASGTGGKRFHQVSGGGLPPSPVAGLVTLDNGKTVPFVIGASGDSPLEASPGNPGSPSSVNQPKNRVYWYVQ